ncbi:MAG TPA: hypothetical protein VGH73_14085 [Thermoanaerobaculia bacterium]|jgi:hypothetical protein
MSNPFIKPYGWTINNWTPVGPTILFGIPDNCMQQWGPMLIGIEPPTSPPTMDLYSLRWLNQNGEICSAWKLEFDTAGGLSLNGNGVTVNFGGLERRCFLTLTLTDANTLSGTISIDLSSEPLGPEVGSGTFGATANAGPPILEQAGATQGFTKT